MENRRRSNRRELTSQLVLTKLSGDGSGEKVEIDIPNIILKGANSANPEATVITYDALAGKKDPSNTLEHTLSGAATISIRPEAIGFKAQDITFKNEYNNSYYFPYQKLIPYNKLFHYSNIFSSFSN